MANVTNEKKVDIDLVSGYSSANYNDGDIVVFDNIEKLQVDGTVKLYMIAMVFCTKGRLQCEVNGVAHKVKAGDVLVCLPNMQLENLMVSPNYDSKIVGLSYEAAQRNMQVNRDLIDILSYVSTNPVIHLDRERQDLFLKYYAVIAHKIKNSHGYFHKEIMHSLLQCTMYELFAIISPYVEYSNEGGSVKQANLLFKKFIELLTKNDGYMYPVKKYAEDLCITPKYLSSISKMVTGHTALEWIHNYTVKTIEQYLRRSNLSIKEISEKLGFPNLSFFGKFTKNHLGMSPTQYRKSMSLKKTPEPKAQETKADHC